MEKVGDRGWEVGSCGVGGGGGGGGGRGWVGVWRGLRREARGEGGINERGGKRYTPANTLQLQYPLPRAEMLLHDDVFQWPIKRPHAGSNFFFLFSSAAVEAPKTSQLSHLSRSH